MKHHIKKTAVTAVSVLTSSLLLLCSCADNGTVSGGEASTLSTEAQQAQLQPTTEPATEDELTKQRRERLQTAVNEYMAQCDFSGSILISVDGVDLAEYSHGFADKSNATPNTRSTKIELGSITKQFTSVAIMQLQEQGKLSVSDTVDTYIPEYDFGDQMTVENLLNMTSGIPDFLNSMIYLQSIGEIDMMEPATFEDVLSFANSNGIEFTPGSSFSYSNTNYMLLGEIIARQSGVTYEKFVEENILKPLGMTNTSMNMNDADAVGYLIDGTEGDKSDTTYFGAAGEIASCTVDMSRWLNGLTSGKVVSQNSLYQMLGDSGMGYGYGWFISQNGYYWHTGQSMACYTMDLMSLDYGINVIVLSNVDDENVETICVDLYNATVGAIFQ
ncbi:MULTISPECIES: serine hydrolase [unclassified Ruminococcus]|uniref:serine hydrolase domain-containing protein n=1 Tax=unclassified Ruminococcus TaxID=2608920 RepID=UPI00210E143C|nr:MULTISPECIES: serine hydrolase domain-containing protein [unclassified Ruminococcus]MCQ4021789.1 serine hydrolase [Ruminococcus sp. zg-924]MCQ4114233.1 serine hydrolase [Ruminococcus sp. zg-921]